MTISVPNIFASAPDSSPACASYPSPASVPSLVSPPDPPPAFSHEPMLMVLYSIHWSEVSLRAMENCHGMKCTS